MTTYILPGMGADSSMYGETFRKLSGVNYVNWPPYHNEQTITEISKRIIRENKIQPGDIVGGSSLGGIVASEISRHVNLGKIILIGSTLTPDRVSPMLKKFATFSEIIPLNLIQLLTDKVSGIVENRLLKMFSQSETLFIKAMCKAIFEWEGNPNPNCSVAHIHGGRITLSFPP